MEGELRTSMEISPAPGQNCKDRSADCTVWTDEKHNSYLNLLESSFVKRLHQSKNITGKFSEKKRGDTNTSHKLSSGAHKSSEEFTVLRNGCWQKIKYEKTEPLPHASADSRDPLKNSWIHRLKRKEMNGFSPTADMQDSLKVLTTQRHGDGIKSGGVERNSIELFANDPFSLLLDLTLAEGTGQNFSDEDNQNASNIEPQAKKGKEALADSSCQDQTVPTNDHSASHNPTPEEELSR